MIDQTISPNQDSQLSGISSDSIVRKDFKDDRTADAMHRRQARQVATSRSRAANTDATSDATQLYLKEIGYTPLTQCRRRSLFCETCFKWR